MTRICVTRFRSTGFFVTMYNDGRGTQYCYFNPILRVSVNFVSRYEKKIIIKQSLYTSSPSVA